MARSLSLAREQFCMEVASGKSYIDAYIVAYPKAAAWKPASAHNQAHKLAKIPEIATRIEQIKSAITEKVQKKIEWNLERSVEVLAEIAVSGEKEAARVSAIKELNSIFGYHAPKKMDHSSADGTMSPQTTAMEAAVLEAIIKKHSGDQ